MIVYIKHDSHGHKFWSTVFSTEPEVCEICDEKCEEQFPADALHPGFYARGEMLYKSYETDIDEESLKLCRECMHHVA